VILRWNEGKRRRRQEKEKRRKGIDLEVET
jgi:hypothetical protein